MHQARLLIINSESWNAPISLHPLCGNHAQELSHAVPGDEEIAVHSGLKYQVRQQLTRRRWWHRDQGCQCVQTVRDGGL